MTAWEKLKNNPVRLEKLNKWKREWYAKKRLDKEWMAQQIKSKMRHEQKRKSENQEEFKKKAVEKSQRYIRKHPFKRMVRTSNSNFDDKITPFDLWKLAKRQKLKCAITKDKLTLDTISLDHIIPKSKGGKNVIKNIRFIREDINYAKRSMTDKELLEMCKQVVIGFQNL